MGVAAALLAGLAAAPADASIAWSGCVAARYQCGSLQVPLDRSGAVPGSVKLSVTRKVAQANPSRTAIVALAGGPGQAAQPYVRSFATLLAAGLTDQDLLVFDQRGTGKSAPISCNAFKQRGSTEELIGRCANELGPRRAFYTSADTVQDIEALRVEGGYEQLILSGVSYGTKVALAYAAAHPERTKALVLDSTVLPEGPDSLGRPTALAVTRVLRDDLCARNACADATPNAVSDLRVLATRLAQRSMKAPVYDGGGRRYTASIGPSGLLDVFTAGDLNPAIRAQLPAAVRSALKGDRQPLLRLSANALGLDSGDPVGAARRGSGAARLQADDDESEFGDGALYLATLCEENPTFPWTRMAPLSQRTRELATAVSTAPAGSWGLFPASVGLGSFAGTCVGWNVATAAPPASGALPDVPTLVLSGLADVRTPLEDAQQLVTRLPQAKLVQVGQTGHSVLTGEAGTCGQDALSAFLRGAAISACRAAKPFFAPTGRAPRSLADISKARNLPARAGRTLNVLPAALADARRAIVGEIFATGAVPKAVGGLRGGSVRVHSESRWTLRRYELVPGVRISGTYRQNGTSTFTFSGSKAASGVVRVTEGGRATGRLGGSRVNARPRAAGAAVSGETGLSWAGALRAARAAPAAPGP